MRVREGVAVRGCCIIGAVVEGCCSSGRNARTRAPGRKDRYGTPQEHSMEHSNEPRSLRPPQSQTKWASGQELLHTHVPSRRQALESVWSGGCVTLGMNRELYERIVVPNVMYGSESWDMRVEERNNLDVTEINCIRSMFRVTRWDRWRNEVVREKLGVPETLSRRVYIKVLKCFGQFE